MRFHLPLSAALLAATALSPASAAPIATEMLRALLPPSVTVAGKQSAAPEVDENTASYGPTQVAQVSGSYAFGDGEHVPDVTIEVADTGLVGANNVSAAAASTIASSHTTATGYEKSYMQSGDFYTETWEAAPGGDPEANLTVLVNGRISLHIDARNATMADAKAILAAIGVAKLHAAVAGAK